jgi:hypothetical protein
MQCCLWFLVAQKANGIARPISHNKFVWHFLASLLGIVFSGNDTRNALTIVFNVYRNNLQAYGIIIVAPGSIQCIFIYIFLKEDIV